MSNVNLYGHKKVVEIPVNQELVFEQVNKGEPLTRVSFNSRFLGHIDASEVDQFTEEVREAAEVFQQVFERFKK